MKEGWASYSEQLEEMTSLLTGKLPNYTTDPCREKGYQARLSGLYDVIATQVLEGASPAQRRRLDRGIGQLTLELQEKDDNIHGRTDPNTYPQLEQPDLPLDESTGED